MDFDVDKFAKFVERKAAEIELFWNEATEFVDQAVELNSELFRNTVNDILSGLDDLNAEATNAGGDASNTDVDVEAELRDKLDNEGL